PPGDVATGQVGQEQDDEDRDTAGEAEGVGLLRRLVGGVDAVGQADGDPGRGQQRDEHHREAVGRQPAEEGGSPFEPAEAGWWRDRAGATERLLGRLATLPGRPLTSPSGAPFTVGEVIAVVEGRARDAAAPDGVRVVRAAGSGDDALAATAADLAAAGSPP